MELNKIIFPDGTIFSTAEYPIETEPPIFSKRVIVSGEQRDTIRITVSASYADVAAKFVPGAVWAIRQRDTLPDGTELDTYTDYDKSDYIVLGDIVDHRDGRVTVYMGKKTESEKMQDTIDQLVLEALGGIA